jgi:hypothetical protein
MNVTWLTVAICQARYINAKIAAWEPRHMATTYRLRPINLEHESWMRSKVRGQFVRVLANDRDQARRRTAAAAATAEVFVPEPPIEGYYRWVRQVSPWEIDDVTSCEEDPSGPPMPTEHIVCEDGNEFPARW